MRTPTTKSSFWSCGGICERTRYVCSGTQTKPLRARDSDQWGEIGFQGRDPATDFRGLGILSLSNLVYFSKQHPSEALYCLRFGPRAR